MEFFRCEEEDDAKFSAAIAPIGDLALAPRDVHGLMEYRATFAILRPLGAASGIPVYDVANRGHYQDWRNLQSCFS